MHGKIKMTKAEWNEVYKYAKNRLFDDNDIDRRIITEKSFIINLRATLTENIVFKYGINKKYRPSNYMIEIMY